MRILENSFAQACRIVEGAVFCAPKPIQSRDLADLVSPGTDISAVLSVLQEEYHTRGVLLVCSEGGWHFKTAPDVAALLTKTSIRPRRLSRVAMEALAIIAYHQPITRSEIEHIRDGLLPQATLDLLVSEELITVVGHLETPGRPAEWGTTATFLEQFNIKGLRSLPRKEDLLSLDITSGIVSEKRKKPEISNKDDGGIGLAAE